MRLLIDTQSLIWFVEGDPKLKESHRIMIADEANTTFVSIASYWEMAIKIAIGKFELQTSLEEFIVKATADGFELLSISMPHIFPLIQLPHHHKDPFDRLIISQAIVENLEIVTTDEQFKHYPIVLHQ